MTAKHPSEHLRRSVDALAKRLREANAADRASLAEALESLRILQGDTADRRLSGIGSHLARLEQRLSQLGDDAESELRTLQQQLAELGGALSQARATALLRSLIEMEPAGAAQVGETILDHLIAEIGADRGFVVFYSPETTEVEIVAARNFQTRNVSLEEYTFSRTILRDVLECRRGVLIDDAAGHPDYAAVESVRALQLRSVIAAPLTYRRCALGAVYLEDSTRAGAFDAADLALLEAAADAAIACLRRARLLPTPGGEMHVFLNERRACRELVGGDRGLLRALEVVGRVKDSMATVLLDGESGTGKELIARALHFESIRKERPFVAINCAAIPHELLEAELFGHEKGAFTGAGERRVGRLEQADGGTVLLDEISELPYAQQGKLLRFLQSGELQRVGSSAPSRVDVRVVAATSKDLRALVESGKFQQALYYRLHVIPVQLPPLRERRGDIRPLAEHFVRRAAEVYGRRMNVDEGVFDRLLGYAWPGNVRELENLAHRLVALATDDWIRVGDLPPEILRDARPGVGLAAGSPAPAAGGVTDPALFWRHKQEVLGQLAQQEALIVERALEETGGSVSEAARRLGIHRVTLHRLLKRHRAGRR